jgi:restriction system protein
MAAKVIFGALKFLKDNDGEAPGREVVAAVEKRVSFDDWERETVKGGSTRWRRCLGFYSIVAVKAGYLKRKGRWFLTPEGEAALSLGAEELYRRARAAYKQFKKERDQQVTPVETEVEDVNQTGAVMLQDIEQQAIEGIRAQIFRLNPYEFQDLVAALLRGMGYYTPFIAPRGKDGGIDVVAYRDPLGTQSPRMKVQVKLRESPASGPEVRQLLGVLQRDDVGIFISAGGFTPDARQAVSGTQVHVELIDLERFISLWQEYYPKLTDEDKKLLPLQPIFFYSPQL